MPRHIDRAMLLMFAEEFQSYLPKIRAGIANFHTDPSQHAALAEAHRYVHTIKGAASMLGLTVLSHLAYYVEELLDETLQAHSSLDAAAVTWIRDTLTHLEVYLHTVLGGHADDSTVVTTVVPAFRRLKHLPESGDMAAIQTVLATRSPELPLTPTASAALALEAAPSSPVLEMPRSQVTEDAFEIPAELIEGFLLEAEDYLNVLGRELPELTSLTARQERLRQIRRSVHTLKGAAGIVGFHDVARLAHRMEDLLDALYEQRLPWTPQAQALLLHTFDTLDEFLRGRSAAAGLAVAAQALELSYRALLAEAMDTTTVPPLPPESSPPSAAALPALTEVPENAAPKAWITPPVLPAPGSLRSESRQGRAMVRVPLARVDALVNLLGEMVISHSTYEQHLERLARQVDELRLSLERLRHVAGRVEAPLNVLTYRADDQGADTPPLHDRHHRVVDVSQPPQRAEFDTLELDRYSEFALIAREMAENTADLETLGQDFRDILGDFESYMVRHQRLTTEIQDKLMRLRMIPLATLSTRLQRTVRVTAEQRDKRVTLVLEGEEVEFDKTVLEEMADPLLHLLRNAVDHGIEPPELRRVLGKPAEGRICLRAFTEGTQVVIQVSDDGAGLEPQLLRAAAVRDGLVSATEAAQWSDEQLWSLIFTPGFSTTEQINEVSGRGVGMDVVETAVSRLKGRVTLESTPGHGVTFTMRLPMKLALSRVLLVRSYGETFALPLADVLQIVRLEAHQLELQDQVPMLRLHDQLLPVLYLGAQLHVPVPLETVVERPPAVLLQGRGKRVVCVVDQLLGEREVVVKSLGNHLRRVNGILGSTVMGDGRVVLILNPLELLQEARLPRAAQRPLTMTPGRSGNDLEVLIVDDSFSVRRVVANLIKNAGWQPVVARDGLEALETIQRAKRLPDVILLDVEMPQMDGYELTATLRAHATYRHIPIIMLTSRSGAKHRQKAFAVGATEYLVKPYQDETLLRTIRHLVSQGEMHRHA